MSGHRFLSLEPEGQYWGCKLWRECEGSQTRKALRRLDRDDWYAGRLVEASCVRGGKYTAYLTWTPERHLSCGGQLWKNVVQLLHTYSTVLGMPRIGELENRGLQLTWSVTSGHFRH